jgi:hypothetical protein
VKAYVTTVMWPFFSPAIAFHGDSRRTYMFLHSVLALFVAVAMPVVSVGQDPCVVAVSHTYEARIRVNGKVSTTRVQASDAGHAKKLVQSQFPGATVLSVKKVD